MEEKKDVLQVELEKAQADLKEIIDNSPEAKAKRKIARIERQIREKEARKVRKELEKAIKKTKKASREVEKISARRQEVAMSGIKWERDKMKASADVQRFVAQEMGLRARIKELEMAEQPRDRSFVDIMRGGKTSDKFEVSEE